MAKYLEVVSHFAANLSFDDLSAQVVEHALDVIVDTIAVIAAGAQEEEICNLTNSLVPKSHGLSTLLSDGRKAPLLEASLLNGTAGTFLELDEGSHFSRGHPAVHVIPALLALGENLGSSGKDFISALVVGYEIGSRIGNATKIRMSMHPHGTWGTVGAAVAAGRLCGIGPAGIREIINISSSLALSTSRKTMLEGATVRNAYSGISNHLGLLSMQLYKAGFTGESDGLQTVYGSVISDQFEPDIITDKLGQRYEINRNYFKKHACCRYIHSALDALELIAELFPSGRIPTEDVQEVLVETYSFAAQLNKHKPKNMLAAKFSIPFAIAAFLINGHAGESCFKDGKISEERTQALAASVNVIEDPAMTKMMPFKRPSRVTIRMKDGSEHKGEILFNKGDIESPYNSQDLVAKYYELTSPIWGQDRAQSVYRQIRRLPYLDHIGKLTEPLCTLWPG